MQVLCAYSLILSSAERQTEHLANFRFLDFCVPMISAVFRPATGSTEVWDI